MELSLFDLQNDNLANVSSKIHDFFTRQGNISVMPFSPHVKKSAIHEVKIYLPSQIAIFLITTLLAIVVKAATSSQAFQSAETICMYLFPEAHVSKAKEN